MNLFNKLIKSWDFVKKFEIYTKNVTMELLEVTMMINVVSNRYCGLGGGARHFHQVLWE